jgi:hypothetical protein
MDVEVVQIVLVDFKFVDDIMQQGWHVFLMEALIL